MKTSKDYRETKEAICKCGCGQTFYPVRFWGKAKFPEYIRGHHPNCRKKQFGLIPAWNKGMKKRDHPSLERMGFQVGHKSFFSWKDVHEIMDKNPTIREKWLNAKKGQTPWNKGLTKDLYENGIKSGPEHGNWKGNKRGIYDLAVLKEFNKSILKRDNYTCQQCGDHNYLGRGSRIKLNVHHIIAIKEDVTQALNPQNAITLCYSCHVKTENYGTKLIHKRRKQAGN